MTSDQDLAKLRETLSLALTVLGVPDAELHFERPRDPDHGDWSTNIALTLASRLQRSPRQIAEELVEALDLDGTAVVGVEVAGPGFLNFRLSDESVAGALTTVLGRDLAYGRNDSGRGRPIMVEWVSANPTGPLHFGHGRQAALGDAVASLLEWNGWNVHREFYFNDAGRQMELLAASVHSRYLQQLGTDADVPDGGYRGEYVIDVARELESEVGDMLVEGSAEALQRIRLFASAMLIREIQRDLADFGIAFDEYFRESSLYEDGSVERTVESLREAGMAYDADGAVWLRTTAFGDQKDRVVVKSDGSPTYSLVDVAYHLSKWGRGFERVINVQGSDHHGTVGRVRAGLSAMGLPEDYPEYVLHQMVTVERGGEEVKLSKRAGSNATLRELFEEVGVDVARYFFQMRKPDAHLIFDLNVATDQSEKNPVYKVQYAHARMHSIYAKAGISGEDCRG